MKKVAFYTLGCKVNQYESDSIGNELSKPIILLPFLWIR